MKKRGDGSPELLAAPGQIVRRGQPLAVLQSVDIGKARAEAITSQTRLELAKKTLERKRSMAAENIVSVAGL